jgi:hypothetical protein
MRPRRTPPRHWREIVARVLEDDVVDRRVAWLDECAAAQKNLRVLRQSGVDLTPPGYVSAWSPAS